MVRLTDRPDMTLDVYLGCKTTKQQHITCILIRAGRDSVCLDDLVRTVVVSPVRVYLHVWRDLQCNEITRL